MKRIVYIIKDFGRDLNRKHINAFAASTSFFLFLSLIPMLILICSIIPYTPVTESDLMEVLTTIAPDGMDSLIIGMIADVYDKSIGILSVAAVGTLWSAGKGVQALMQGLNAIHDVEEKRNAILSRLIASIYTILLLILLVLSLVLMVFGNTLVELLEGNIPQISYLFHSMDRFRGIAVWGIVTLFIAVIYAYMPGKKNGLKSQLPGAVVSSVGWSAITWVFSVYVDVFNGFSMYGSLTTIIILMLWLYSCIYTVMIGAFINRYFKPFFHFLNEKRKRKKETG